MKNAAPAVDSMVYLELKQIDLSLALKMIHALSTWTNPDQFVAHSDATLEVFANDKRECTMTHSMHHRLDQYTKNLLRDALSLVSKLPETEVEVLAATQKIDVFATPDPSREKEREQLGLLGELSREPSMFEAFSNTPSLKRVRRCLSKQLAWHHEQERRARVATGGTEEENEAASSTDLPEIVPFPRLIVVTPGRPETVLSVFGATNARSGVYELVAGLHTYVIVAVELPETRETLLLRLMGCGHVLAKAVADLKALPKNAWERSIAMPLLVHFRLDVELSASNNEEPMSAEIQAWFEDYQKKMRVEGAREVLLRQLRLRFGDVPASTVARIESADGTLVEKWCDRILSAPTLAAIFDEAN